MVEYINDIGIVMVRAPSHQLRERVIGRDVVRSPRQFLGGKAVHAQEAHTTGKRISRLFDEAFALGPSQPEQPPLIRSVADDLYLLEQRRCLLDFVNQNRRAIQLEEELRVALS